MQIQYLLSQKAVTFAAAKVHINIKRNEKGPIYYCFLGIMTSFVFFFVLLPMKSQ